MVVPQPCGQHSQTCPVSVGHRGELQSHSICVFIRRTNRVGPGLSPRTRKSILAVAPTGCGVAVPINRPPTLRFRTGEISSRRLEHQQTKDPSPASTREVRLLEKEGVLKKGPMGHLRDLPCDGSRLGNANWAGTMLRDTILRGEAGGKSKDMLPEGATVGWTRNPLRR